MGTGAVAATAFIVAEYRAEENGAAAPLYSDPIVAIFLDDTTRRAAAEAAAPSPESKDAVKLRTRYLDDVLEQRIEAGCRQIVILGAGLDTRAVRKRRSGVTYFEFDDEATLELKAARFRDHGIEANLRLIPANYATEDWLALLEHSGFDGRVPTHFIWEGNTMYLTLAQVTTVLAQIRAHVARATVSFDYLSAEAVAATTGDPKVTALVERFARLGAPWITGIADIRGFAEDRGFELIDSVSTAGLHRAYWPGRPLKTHFLDHYFVCTLAIPSGAE